MAKGGELRDSFFKCDPVAAYDGSSELDADSFTAYWRLIFKTMQRGKLLADDDVERAHDVRMGLRRWRRLKADLLAAGRIRIEGGKIVDDYCLRLLTMRREEREQAVSNGRIGGTKSASMRDVSPIYGPNIGDRSAIDPVEKRVAPLKSPDIFQGGLNQVESESELGLPDLEIDSYFAGDLTALGELPPLPADSPLLANVVAVGVSLAGIADPAQLHAELVAAAGPRLQAGDVLRGSIGFLARALAAGCDPDRDVLPVVIERTFGRGGPIPTWRYFLDAWLERRDERMRAGGAGEGATALEPHAVPGKPVENPGDDDADPVRASA